MNLNSSLLRLKLTLRRNLPIVGGENWINTYFYFGNGNKGGGRGIAWGWGVEGVGVITWGRAKNKKQQQRQNDGDWKRIRGHGPERKVQVCLLDNWPYLYSLSSVLHVVVAITASQLSIPPCPTHDLLQSPLCRHFSPWRWVWLSRANKTVGECQYK